MAANTRAVAEDRESALASDLLVRAYSNMVSSRKIDDKMLVMLKQSKGYFHIGVSGHECAQTAAALSMRPGVDWALPYYRGVSVCHGLGVSAEELFLQFFGRATDPASGGRQLPNHFGHVQLRIPSQSSPTGSQYLQAVGIAHGIMMDGTDEVVYVSSGEGATSEGDFHEALSWASRYKLPVVFHIEDNGFSISVPRHEEVPGESVYDMASGYPDIARYDIDGTDWPESYTTFQKAIARAREGKGPAVVVTQVVRLLSHSNADDHTKYRSKEEVEADRKRDPIPKLRKLILKEKVRSAEQLDVIDKEIKTAVDEAADAAEAHPKPDPATADDFVYSPDGGLFFTETAPPTDTEPIVMVDAINHALDEELERNDKMVIFGQDVAHGKGGVFTATRGLTAKHGVERVFNAPIAEAAIAGVAIGLALRGYKPVVEIQFADYMWTAINQIRNELATMRYRSNNTCSAPVVLRIPCGGYIHGALYHSQSVEAYLAHMPGLRVALPSNAIDAKGLLKTAIRGEDPVLFLECKALYRQGYAKRPEPGADWMLPFGKAAVVREGTDATIVTYGNTVHRSLEAARAMEEEQGVQVEVIDLRTISPLDTDTILTSVAKTNRALVVYEANLTAGFGAEIAARIADAAFEQLDAPVKRVAAKDAPCPYNPDLEAAILPQTADIQHALKELVAY